MSTIAFIGLGGISAAYGLTDLELDLDRCIANAPTLLHRVGVQIARDWLG